ACVSWYGMLRYGETSQAKPISPLELVPRLRCPYLGLFGADDAIIPQADVDELRAQLAEQRQPTEVHVYQSAGHAFFNDTRPEAAAAGCRRRVGFLHQRLG